MSFRNVEEILTYRGIEVTYESIRQWGQKFGPEYAKKIRSSQGKSCDIWFLDEVFTRDRAFSEWKLVVIHDILSANDPVTVLNY